MQLTVIRITGYGPWTLTLGSDREHELQMLQASLYADLQKLFSERGCLVFPNRHDELFAVTSGLDARGHAEILQKISVRGPGLTMAIGCAEEPLDADMMAHKAREAGELLGDGIFGRPGGQDGPVTIMHLDVDDVSSQARSRSPYEVSSAMFGLYARMSAFFVGHGALTFFMGGDNFMVVSGPRAKGAVRGFLDEMNGEGVILNCGIGTGGSAREAACLATKSLDRIREIRDSGGEKPQVYELP